MNDIHIIITGGTIDSEYFPPEETSKPNPETVIPTYISSKIRPHKNVTFEPLFMLDSGDITEEHRGLMAEHIKAQAAKSILITHGTNTMSETADYLEKALKGTDKTIILTGSMIPLKEYAMSDAGFNLGYAFAQSQNLSAGVYICMHGETFPAGQAIKNRADARFEKAA